jgi:hypothetical protein
MTQQKRAAPARQEMVELSLTCVDCGHEIDRQELNRSELEARAVAQLPDREAMSLVNANLAAPINLALAANVLSDNSAALAAAQQTAPIGQGI